ncbi:MAG TPA: N-acetylmuramoyl-L-alanine amidase [Gemmatimonadales bacterium]|nr:N-acetylmuramoyl-L-alanine amidase [Gemmatimonadales bacterium]
MLVSRTRGWALWLMLAAPACSSKSDPSPVPRTAEGPDPGPAELRLNHSELHAAPEVQDPIGLRVIYPAPTDLVRASDSSFLFGSVADGKTTVTINGHPVRVWPNGAWLAWIPFPPDTVMHFTIAAHAGPDSSVLVYPVRRDRGTVPREISQGSAWIDSVSLSPQGQVWVPRNEYLTFSTRAVEGADVRVRLPGGRVIRLLPQRQSQEVLPALRAFDRDTTKLRTPEEVRYVGVMRGRAIGPDAGPVLRGPTASLVRVLARAAVRCVTGGRCPAPYAELVSPDSSWAVVEAALARDTVRLRWPVQVALLDTLPVVTQLDDDTAKQGNTDSMTAGRATPGGTYAWFFPTGTRASVTGRVNDDLRIRLSPASEAWVPIADAQRLPAGLPEPRAVVGSVTLIPSDDRATLRIPLTQRVPFQVVETERSLAITFYSAVGDVDWMRYGTDSLVRQMSWAQTQRQEVTLTVDLWEPVWGYRARWSRNDLLLEIRRPPRIKGNDPLRGRVIAIDPGHPPLGSTGPTGLREAEANLAVALQLRGMLQAAGARVAMTRTTDSAVDLWPRVALAESSAAELLVSIHNNALPDGINPFTNNGTSVFYNQPRSAPLASAIQRRLVRRLGLPDLGISRADFAIARATWMPSVLVEGMFIIMPDQEAALRSPAGARRYARGVYEGIRDFLQDRAGNQPPPGVGRSRPRASPRANSSPSRSVPPVGAPDGGVDP